MQNENELLEKRIIKLHNAYLQARINPHFLFNTLNFIYNQVEELDPDAGKNIVLLSDIMQYSLANVESDGKVPLFKEIEHIKRYIRLNLSRFDNRLYLVDEIQEVVPTGLRIPPLLLLTFVENVFKHGDMTDENCPGRIRITCEEGNLLLYTENKMRKSKIIHREHVGIRNAFTRLKNYYPKENLDLKISAHGNKFILTLKIML